jgi:hypothetical protein
MTKADAISDLELRLTGGKPSDDVMLWRSQMSAWLGQAINAQLEATMGRTRTEAIGEIPGQLYKEYTCQAVVSEVGDDWCGPGKRYFVPMPSYTTSGGDIEQVAVAALPRNMGIHVWIGSQKIERAASRGEVRRLLDFGCDEFWYLLGERVYLHGGNYPSKVKVLLQLLVTSIDALDDSDPIPALNPKEVLDMAEEIGRRQMGTPQDITNDGQAAAASL